MNFSSLKIEIGETRLSAIKNLEKGRYITTFNNKSSDTIRGEKKGEGKKKRIAVSLYLKVGMFHGYFIPATYLSSAMRELDIPFNELLV